MGPSKPPNRVEREWMDKAARVGCLACRQEGHYSEAAIHHITSGFRRMGHLFTIPLCHWHHQLGDDDRPSVHGAKKRFAAKYGSELDLLRALQVELGVYSEVRA